MRIGSRIPGLPGLFIAGLFSGGLSSMSGGLNTISCTIYEDFLKNKFASQKHLFFFNKKATHLLKTPVISETD